MNAKENTLKTMNALSKVLYFCSIVLWIPAEILFGRIACSIARREVSKFFKD